ncbi:MAG: undecaprenyl-diphosphate phosphatase [Eubacteriales bacterium]|nr:undecaprenyl-diphosphate phosphatase [Eubacteriales bacterium]
MNGFQAFILGMVQGLTEFLPVSSSGHLLMLEKVFGISSGSEGTMTMMVLLHVGTLLAVFVVYWQRILNMILHPIRSELKWLILATIPAVIAALTVNFSAAFEGAFLCWSFWLTSVVLLAGDAIGQYRRKTQKPAKEVGFKHALTMGMMQAVAILPGLSRSGSTISGGVASGLSRKRAADFSFLMSIPAILGSVVLEGVDIIKGEAAPSTIGFVPILIGIIAAAIFGFLAIKLMLRIVKNTSLKWFALYTFVLGSLILVDKYLTHFFAW